jgi:hypothetical protein
MNTKAEEIAPVHLQTAVLSNVGKMCYIITVIREVKKEINVWGHQKKNKKIDCCWVSVITQNRTIFFRIIIYHRFCRLDSS